MINGPTTSQRAVVWKDAPELAIPDLPALLCDSNDLWLAYRSYRGFSIVRFLDVIDHRLSPINDEGMGEHPNAKAGLQFHAFNEIIGSAEAIKWSAIGGRHWVVTFKDNTLDVVAKDAKVAASEIHAATPTAALLQFLHSQVSKNSSASEPIQKNAHFLS